MGDGERTRAPFCVRGATVIDGTGADPKIADVLVDARGTITEVAAGATAKTAGAGAAIVQGAGLVLAPGFIDLHSHSDLYTLVRDGEGTPIGDAPKLSQGCTAQVFGQDGISAAPVSNEDLEDHAAFLAGLDGTIARSLWTWRSFGEYLESVRASSATRTAALVGHATVRRLVMGDEARSATDREIEQMQEALVRAFEEGACGFSSGLVYVPAAYADTAEVAALCEVVAARDLPFFVHVRSESERVVEATDEVIEIAARTGCRLHYSHIKAAGRSNWHKAAMLIDRIDAARGAGVRVSADVHPYVAGSTSAIVLLPPWVQEGGQKAALRRLRDRSVRARLRHQLMADTTSWDNWWAFSDGWRGLRVARVAPARDRRALLHGHHQGCGGERHRLPGGVRRDLRPARQREPRDVAHLVQQRRGERGLVHEPAVLLDRDRRRCGRRWAPTPAAARDLPESVGAFRA